MAGKSAHSPFYAPAPSRECACAAGLLQPARAQNSHKIPPAYDRLGGSPASGLTQNGCHSILAGTAEFVGCCTAGLSGYLVRRLLSRSHVSGLLSLLGRSHESSSACSRKTAQTRLAAARNAGRFNA